MFKNFFFWLFAAFFIGIFIWAAFVPKTDIDKKISVEIENQKKKADMFMKGVIFSEISEGIKFWEIKSITSVINNNTNQALLKQVQGEFFSKGKPVLNFISPKVLWDMKNKNIIIENPLGFDNKFKFKTDVLNWAMNTQLLSTESEVVFEGDDMLINGKGLRADVNLDKMMIKGRPKAKIKRNRELIEVEADVFNMNGETDTISAVGSAIAKKPDLIMEAREIDFGRMKKYIAAMGSVTVNFKDIYATANAAKYDINAETISLSGSAKANKSGSTLSGNRLLLDMKNNKIALEGRVKTFIEDEVMTKETK